MDSVHLKVPATVAVLVVFAAGCERQATETIMDQQPVADNVPCIPTEGGEDGCPGDDPPNPNAQGGLWVNGWTAAECVPGRRPPLWFKDDDSDGLHDFCEVDLAYAFRPELVVSEDCNWDYGLDRMGGEYLYAAQVKPGTTRDIRLVYMMAYYWDCSAGIGTKWDKQHSGDSEYIIVDLMFDEEWVTWRTTEACLSAHGHCDWRAPYTLQFVDQQPEGALVSYVSVGKHANYRSISECGSFDTCIPSAPSYRFPILQFADSSNVGSRAAPRYDHTGPIWSSVMTDDGAKEYMWTNDCHLVGVNLVCSQRFNGWQDEIVGPAPVPYGWILQSKAGF